MKIGSCLTAQAGFTLCDVIHSGRNFVAILPLQLDYKYESIHLAKNHAPFITLIFILCVYRGRTHMCRSTPVELKDNPHELVLSFPPCGSWESRSGCCQPWWQDLCPLSHLAGTALLALVFKCQNVLDNQEKN